jgi:hypothetical protein
VRHVPNGRNVSFPLGTVTRPTVAIATETLKVTRVAVETAQAAPSEPFAESKARAGFTATNGFGLSAGKVIGETEPFKESEVDVIGATQPFKGSAVNLVGGTAQSNRSAVFSFSPLFEASHGFRTSPIPTPLQSLEGDQSYSVTLSRSLTQSATRFLGTTVSWRDSITLTVTHSSNTWIVQELSTRLALVTSTLIFSMIPIPVYVRTVIPVRIDVLFTRTAEGATQMSAGMLLAVVSGGAVLAAVFAGIVVFFVRSRRSDSYGGSSSELEVSAPLFELATADKEDAPEEHQSSRCSIIDTHLSSDSVNENASDEGELYI